MSAPPVAAWLVRKLAARVLGVAAGGLGLVSTWLHPLGALDDQLDVIADAGVSALIVAPRTHAQRGGELAAAYGLVPEQARGGIALPRGLGVAPAYLGPGR